MAGWSARLPCISDACRPEPAGTSSRILLSVLFPVTACTLWRVSPRMQSPDENEDHRAARHRLSDHSRRHAVGRHCRAGIRGLQRRRPRHPDRADAADARRSATRDRALPRHDRQAVRREPDDPARDHAAAVRRVSQRDHRERRQDRRDRRQQSQGLRRAGSRSTASRSCTSARRCVMRCRPSVTASTSSASTASSAPVIPARTTFRI